MQVEDEEYKKSNREKRLTPKSGVHWCDHCDAQLVAVSSKCANCGIFNGEKRLKKEQSARH